MAREDVVEIGRVPRPAVRLRDRVPALSRHWLAWANLFLGALVGAPWLARLTGRPLPQGFYVGNALGSFNSWMRLSTGLLFGLAVAWVAYPALEAVFKEQEK